ncbi:MAG: hypothetical protein ABI700_17190 [Chloroflexota bacterium]
MLPQNASSHSQTLFAQARYFLKTCPPSLYEEVAVSGSVARGIADQYSDCEVGFWVAELQIDAYKSWLESLGSAVTLMRESPDRGRAIYLEYSVDGIKLGTVWQKWDDLEDALAALSADRLPEHETAFWMLAHLIPIGDAPRLKDYQSRVTQYPDTLRRNVIEQRLRNWRWMMGVSDVFLAEPVARRGQLYDLRRRQLMTLKDIFSMLFAFNRLWLPEAKWYNEEAAWMAQKPPQLIERMDTLLTERDPYTVMETMRRLQVDSLRILSADFDVDDLITGLEAIDIKHG